jgi:hypothetical protein
MNTAFRWSFGLSIALSSLLGLGLLSERARAQEVPPSPQLKPDATKEEFQAYAADRYAKLIAPYWKAHCYRCHGNEKATAGLNLQKFRPDFFSPDTIEILDSAHERMRDGEMPPPTEAADPQDDSAERPPADPAGHQVTGALKHIAVAARQWQQDADLDLRPLPIAAADDKLTRLLKQRRNAAALEVEATRAVVEQGIGEGVAHFDNYLEAVTAVVNADLELAERPAAQIVALRQKIAAYRVFESFVWGRFRAGHDPSQVFYRVKGKRLAAQIELERALDRSRPKK